MHAQNTSHIAHRTHDTPHYVSHYHVFTQQPLKTPQQNETLYNDAGYKDQVTIKLVALRRTSASVRTTDWQKEEGKKEGKDHGDTSC